MNSSSLSVVSIYLLMMIDLVGEFYESGQTYSKTIDSLIRSSLVQATDLITDLVLKEFPDIFVPEPEVKENVFLMFSNEIELFSKFFTELFQNVSIEDWKAMQVDEYTDKVLKDVKLDISHVYGMFCTLDEDIKWNGPKLVMDRQDVSRPHVIKMVHNVLKRRELNIRKFIPINDESLGKLLSPPNQNSSEEEDRQFIRKVLKCQFDNE